MTQMTEAQKTQAIAALRKLLRLSPGSPPPVLDLARVRADNLANRVPPPGEQP